jgi:DNA-binding transcriptional MerR regulator
MESPEYTIQEIIQLSGLPRRTIYFYIQQNLLPSPEGAGLAARYSQQHLLRLKLIPLLRGQGLRLDQIREKMASLSIKEAQDLLTQLETSQPPAVSAPIQAHHTYTHYTLPSGITLIVPGQLSPSLQQKVEKLLQSALQILN